MVEPAPDKKVDAVEMLRDDHAELQEMFSEFRRLHDTGAEGVDERKQQLMDKVSSMLTAHAQIEEDALQERLRGRQDDS